MAIEYVLTYCNDSCVGVPLLDEHSSDGERRERLRTAKLCLARSGLHDERPQN